MADKLLVICGPTASGKTAAAIEVCKLIGGEVVSADSMQVYTGMEILSAAPSESEMCGIRHHMLGIASPERRFNASDYRDMATYVIKDIAARGKKAVVCGGAGLYIDALTRGIKLSERADEGLRERLKNEASEHGGEKKLHDYLKTLDPASAEKYPAADVRRVIRSIEINLLTGMTRAEQEGLDAQTPDAFDARLFALNFPRDELYSRIDRRVDNMVEMGLFDEAERLLSSGEHPTAIQAIGYKEAIAYLRGEMPREEAINLIKTASRNYAKRQITWFKRDKRVTWIDAQSKTAAEIAREICDISEVMTW